MFAQPIGRWIAMCAVAACTLSAASSARAEETPPKGIQAGPWVLAPILEWRWGTDSNPFFVSGEAGADSSTAENSTRASAGVAAFLPFRSSRLALAYRREKLAYEKTELRKDTTDDVTAEVRLRFPTADEARIRLGYVDGASETARFDPGGETLFRGDPYVYGIGEVEISRGVLAARGYSVRIVRETFSFPDTEDPGYFEFDGWTAQVEYRVPVRPSAWLVVSYYGRRYDHTCTGFDPMGVPCPSGETPFRVESADAAYVGVRGQLAGRNPFLLTVGYADLRYDGGGEPGYRGPVAEGNVRIPAGRIGFVEAAAFRRFYSSFYLDNNYYVQAGGLLRIAAERADRWNVGTLVQFTNSRYPADDPTLGEPRRDSTWRLEAYANLFLPRQFGLRFAVTDENRDANVEGLGFDRRTFVAGAFFGWY